MTAILARAGNITPEALTAATIRRENEQAVNHLFRVCAGLESMVLGEAQILGQVKRAYEAATDRGAVGVVLHRVFQQAVAVAKQARTETGIDAGRLSVGSVAVDLARGVFERFDDKVVVGIRAGEIAKLTFKHFAAIKPPAVVADESDAGAGDRIGGSFCWGWDNRLLLPGAGAGSAAVRGLG